MKLKFDEAQAQVIYYREKSDNLKEACEWLKKELKDAEATIVEKEKMITTFENI